MKLERKIYTNQEFNKLTTDNLAGKNDIADFVKKRILMIN